MTEQHGTTRPGTVRGAGRAAREHAQRPAPGWPAVILRVTGSGLLIATAAIHLDLYLTGYRTIPTIGWLFLLQIITAFALALAVLVLGFLQLPGSRLLALGGGVFALAVLGGYILSVWIGLFGLKEAGTTAGLVPRRLVDCRRGVRERPEVRHHQAHRRLDSHHLQRPPAVHVHRRRRPRAGARQQHHPERRRVARDLRLRRLTRDRPGAGTHEV